MKVFGVGFHKTGTTTLKWALKELGYSVGGIQQGKHLLKDIKQSNWAPVFEVADQYDALQDNPWPLLYKELDEQYPGSKFILTQRDEDQWIKSLVNHCGDKHADMREWIYGYGNPKGHEDVYRERYRRHYEEVREYFKDREDDFLIVSWSDGDGWEKLCQFLNEPIPETEFPHINKGGYKQESEEKSTIKGWLKEKFGL